MELLNRVYEGFKTEEEVIGYLKEIKYTQESVLKVVKFKKEYYIVGCDLDKRFIAGKELVFFTEADYLTMMGHDRFKAIVDGCPIFKESNFNYLDGFYREMVKEDYDFCIYSVEGDGEFIVLCEANDSSNAYAVNLAMTFCKVSFNKEEVLQIGRYIKNVELYSELYDKYINVGAVYPSLDAVIFKYQGKQEYVRIRIDYSNPEEPKLLLQDSQFAIENPLAVPSMMQKDNKEEKQESNKKEPEYSVVYVLTNRVDDKVFYGLYRDVDDSDIILDELLLAMDRQTNALAKTMAKYCFSDFNVEIIDRRTFKDENDRKLFMLKLIGMSGRELLTEAQNKMRGLYVKAKKENKI